MYLDTVFVLLSIYIGSVLLLDTYTVFVLLFNTVFDFLQVEYYLQTCARYVSLMRPFHLLMLSSHAILRTIKP